MKVKNITNIPQAFTQRVGNPPMREVMTIQPDEEIEVADDIGVNLCRNKGRIWVGADTDSRKMVEDSYPKPQPVTEVRKKVGNTTQALKDIERGKKATSGGD